MLTKQVFYRLKLNTHKMVRKVGLEPTRREAPDFEPSKTTNSITSG